MGKLPALHLFNEAAPLQLLESKQPVYTNTQTLVQHAAYALSDKIFSYSPDTFELDTQLKQWKEQGGANAFGLVPDVKSLEARLGAGRIALGYVFSPDFDLAKRHIPQAIIASTGSLPLLREAFEQLSLLHSLTNPVVAHVNAVDYVGGDDPALFSDYVTSMEAADELGFNLVLSHSVRDAQHTALLSTLLSKFVAPTINTFDGLTSRDTSAVNTQLTTQQLGDVYHTVAKALETTEAKHADKEGKAIRILHSLNKALGTTYEPFEYLGVEAPETVFVTFGSLEATLSAHISLQVGTDHRLGVINVRLYRPFIEEEFRTLLPDSVRKIVVLGQVESENAVEEESIHSPLFKDVLATMSLSLIGRDDISIEEVKYAKQRPWTYDSLLPVYKAALGQQLNFKLYVNPQVDIWTCDSADDGGIWTSVAHQAALLGHQVDIHVDHDNLVEGGITRAKVGGGFSPEWKAAVSYVGSEKLASRYDILNGIREGGAVLLSPFLKTDNLEKTLPAELRGSFKARNISLWTLDISTNPADVLALIQLSVFSILQSVGAIDSADAGDGAVYDVEHAKVVDRTDLAFKLSELLRRVEIPADWEIENASKELGLKPTEVRANSFVPIYHKEEEPVYQLQTSTIAAKGVVFKEAYGTRSALRPDVGVKTAVVHVKEHRRLTPLSYERNVFHIEFDLGDSGLTYAIGEALGIHAENDPLDVDEFIKWYGLNTDDVVQVPSRDDETVLENRTVHQALVQNVDIFGRPPKRFYEALAEFATDENDKKNLLTLSTPAGADEFKRRAEVDTITFSDILAEFPSARPSFNDLVKIVSPLKRREYSIASSQHVTPNSVALLIVTVGWVDPKSRDRFGLATRYLNSLRVGTPVTVSVKPSVMKLPPATTAPIIMAGLGTGLAPFRAFVQERAYQKQVLGQDIGSVLLYLGSRHQREEYLYGEEWEAYQAAGIITLIGAAFSRDQPHKIYIQDRMRQTLEEIRQAYINESGSFYLCGPTWPVPDVTEVLQEAVEAEAKAKGAKKVDGRREIETLKEDGRFVLEVY